MQNTKNYFSSDLQNFFKRLALRYLGRYSSSSQNLKDYLFKKASKVFKEQINQEDPKQAQKILEEINKVILFLQNLGYLNDENYAKNKIKNLSSKGKSNFLITSQLRQKGVDKTTIEKSLAPLDIDLLEMLSAYNFIKKKNYGAFRNQEKEIAKFTNKALSKAYKTHRKKQIKQLKFAKTLALDNFNHDFPNMDNQNENNQCYESLHDFLPEEFIGNQSDDISTITKKTENNILKQIINKEAAAMYNNGFSYDIITYILNLKPGELEEFENENKYQKLKDQLDS
ncbi:RecX family transcriptional regulator [Candidatus Hepatincolaceae symbiont of Richtersius coronifer]